MLPNNSTTTEVSDIAKGAEVTLCSSAQSESEKSDLGVPVENVLFRSTTESSPLPSPILGPTEDSLLSFDDVVAESFTPGDQQQWFYMHAAFGQNKKAQKAFSKENIFTFIPEVTLIGYNSEGEIIKKRKPIFTSYLFVLATHQQVKAFTNTGDTQYSLPYLHFVYNKTDKNQYGACSCLTIPHRVMVSFMRLVKVDSSKVHPVDVRKVRFLKDQPVKIIKGAFKDIVGRVARVHNQTTVVVTLEGVISMTTAYIPKSFMVPYEEDEETTLSSSVALK